jgi:hypothetical protein
MLSPHWWSTGKLKSLLRSPAVSGKDLSTAKVRLTWVTDWFLRFCEHPSNGSRLFYRASLCWEEAADDSFQVSVIMMPVTFHYKNICISRRSLLTSTFLGWLLSFTPTRLNPFWLVQTLSV